MPTDFDTDPDIPTRTRLPAQHKGADQDISDGLDVVVQLHGHIHDHALLILATELSEAIDLRPGWLIIDLTDCTALGTGALQLLADAHGQATSYGGRLVLRDPSIELTRVLAMSGLLTHVTIDRSTQPRAS